MSDTPIYDNLENPTPIYDSVNAEPVTPKKWWGKILNPTFRRWAYGVASALVSVWAIIVGKPEFIAVVAPLLMAIFYVDRSGEPK